MRVLRNRWRWAWLAGATLALGAGIAVASPGLLGGVVGTAEAAIGFGSGSGGGGNTTFTTSTTHHTTYTRKDLPTIQAYQTTVLAYLHTPCCNTLVTNQTFSSAFGSGPVQATVGQAQFELGASGASVITGPTLVASSTASHTDFLGNQLNHVTNTVTTTATFGPATILIGDDQSQSFFVAAGTENFNTNTHTETYMDQVYQATNTLSQTYQLDGNVTGLPPLTVTGQTGPGQRVTVGGTTCTKALFGGSIATGGTVQVTFGFSPPVVVQTASAGSSGGWSVQVTVPPGTLPGVYSVTATCNDPISYPATSLTVGAPAAASVAAAPRSAG